MRGMRRRRRRRRRRRAGGMERSVGRRDRRRGWGEVGKIMVTEMVEQGGG